MGFGATGGSRCFPAPSPLCPANCGFLCHWSQHFKGFSGTALKNIGLSFNGQKTRGEATITDYGLEGGGVYALSRFLREAIALCASAELTLDLRPDVSIEAVADKLATAKHGASSSNVLRKSLHLSPAAINLMREVHGIHLPQEPAALARCVKSIPLHLTAPAPIERAISSAGGIKQSDLDANLQLHGHTGVFAAGEMLDWEAPTGGYLLTGCFATAIAAANGILQRLDRTRA